MAIITEAPETKKTRKSPWVWPWKPKGIAESTTNIYGRNKPEPLGLHAALTGAAFMTAYDRMKTLKGGLTGAGLALGFIGLRKFFTPDSELEGISRTAWNAVEFSAITSLLGSSLMRGGFMYKTAGKPLQRLFSVKGYQKISKMLPADITGGATTLHGATRFFQKQVRESKSTLDDIIRGTIEGKAAATSGFEKFLISSFGTAGGKIAEGAHRVTERYAGLLSKYLRGISVGPRGPYEISSGLFDLSKRLIQAVEQPMGELRGAVKAFMGRKGIFSGQVTAALKRAGFLDEALTSIDTLRKSGVYKGARGVVKYRKFLEGIFGSPTVGEKVMKYGSIKHIPVPEYLTANIQDIMYGATPGLLLMSPLIGWELGKYGLNKLRGKDSADNMEVEASSGTTNGNDTRNKLSSNKTVGLVNNVLHNNKTRHEIEDNVEKTKHLFNVR